MYIVYDTNNDLNALRSKYLVLELDTVEINENTLTAYAVVDAENVILQEITMLDKLKELHENLIKNYRLKNWNYCNNAIEHLKGKFKGELDSFYEELDARIAQLKDIELSDDWSGNIKTANVVSE